MAIKLYGIPRSRALRSIWAIEEVGIEYEHVPTNFAEDSKRPDYLAINPNGRVPALEDGDVKLFESMAINLYLAKTYGGALYPSDPAEEARAIQWSIWGISEIEPLQLQLVVQNVFAPADKRDVTVIAAAKKGLDRPLGVLDAHLDGKPWLLGGDFSIADLNVAAVMLLLQMGGYSLSKFTNVSRWAEACYDRPALARAREMGA